jgi:hypothetical protein
MSNKLAILHEPLTRSPSEQDWTGVIHSGMHRVMTFVLCRI